ncbi:hypothetical protein O3683_11245 [Neisseria flavescens]|jgi:hypothetical protein|uniref:hypothetical protein n=1 Tax=Neisseria flavescens TaxID=484 RepID=UPI00066D8229|nr:MAG TPA: hypothetical protein [Caudoviricetes sp.]DAO76416.1 MAG TPA: hypothetical protein [Bacteriophage sp.]
MIFDFLPVGIAAAMAGGVIGAVYASMQDGDTIGRTVSEALIALVAAAAVAEHFLPPEKVWLCCAGGIGAGLITGYVLDSVRALAPSTVQRVLEKLAGKAADKAE